MVDGLPAGFATPGAIATATAVTAETVTTTTGRARFTWTGFVHRETAAIKLRAIERFNCPFRARIFRHFNKAETT